MPPHVNAISLAVLLTFSSYSSLGFTSTPEFDYDSSSAQEAQLNSTNNPTGFERSWYGTPTSSAVTPVGSEQHIKVSGIGDENYDAIAGWVNDSVVNQKITNNQLFIEGEGTVLHRAIGAYYGSTLQEITTEITDNILVINGGTIQEAWGTLSTENNISVQNNHTVLDGGTVTFLGGVGQAWNGFELGTPQYPEYPENYSAESDFINNRVTVLDGSAQFVYGVYRNSGNGFLANGETSGNIVDVYGGKSSYLVGVITNVAGNYTNNQVIIEGENNELLVESVRVIEFNPILNSNPESQTTISGNIVSISNATAGTMYIIDADPSDSSGHFSYQSNTATLENAEVGYIYGIQNQVKETDEISGTQITLKDSKAQTLTLVKDISTESTSRITNNFVHLLGQSEVSGTLTIIDSASNDITKNGIVAQGIHHVGTIQGKYDELHLIVGQENNVSDGEPVLTINQGDIDLSDINVTIGSVESTSGDMEYSLLHTADGMIHIDKGTEIKGTGTLFTDKVWHFTEDFDKDLLTTGDLIEGTIIPDVKPNDHSKTLAESFLGSVALVHQGAEFIADEGMRAMTEASLIEQSAVFGTIGGGSSKYDTGSSVDVDSMSLITGFVTRIVPKWMVAGFIEAGWGNSESHVENSKTDGDHDYYGFGLATRYQFNSPFYIDSSVRIGRASTEFSGQYNAGSAKYDSDSLYGSAHIGVGYEFKLSENTSLDLYGRYIFSYLEGDTTSLGTNSDEHLDMDDTLAHTVRIGSMLHGQTQENVRWRVGLAYEHVANGDAESDVFSNTTRVSLDVPTLEGNSGIAELGMTIRPTPTNPWALDLGIKGYVGDRQGATGSATVSYSF